MLFPPLPCAPHAIVSVPFLLGSSILFTLFWNTLNLCSFITVRDQVLTWNNGEHRLVHINLYVDMKPDIWYSVHDWAVTLLCRIYFFVHIIYRNTGKIKHSCSNDAAGYVEIPSRNSHSWKPWFMRRTEHIWWKTEACKLCALEILVYFYLLIWQINIFSYSQVTIDRTRSQLRFSICVFFVFLSCVCSKG